MRRTPIGSRTDLPVIPGVSDLEFVASGGSGVVYRGRQEALSRDVAVKVLTAPPDSPASVTRWERERDAMGRLSNHPNIVTVYDSGLTDDGRPYLVMPFIAGGSLGDRIRRDGPLPVDEAVGIGVQIAAALAAAHAGGVLHRDVKPDNVLLSPYEAQLADFGIARFVDSATTGVTGTGLINATINYAAPEVLAGEKATEASDVYGLAATVYAALSGSVPFPHASDASPVAVAHKIIHDPVPVLGGTVPRRVADAVARGMAKDPKDRLATAAEFAAALESAGDAPAAPTTTVAAPVVATEAIPTVTTPRRRATPPPAHARRGPSRALVVGLALVVVAAAALLLLRDDSPRDGAATTADTATPTTAAPSVDNTARVTRTTAVVASGPVAQTARQYFTRLSRNDFAGAYAMLSPEFRAAQSQESFESFWRSASPVSITGEITANGMTARVPIQMGGRSNTYTLTIVRGDDGTLYVDGPRPR